MRSAVRPTTNPDWGFFGAVRHHADPTEAWSIAMQSIVTVTGGSDVATQAFLDSRHGRHFADDVVNGLASGMPLRAAIATAAERWMGWTTGKHVERETGIPRGLPYLTGFVTHFGIMDETAA